MHVAMLYFAASTVASRRAKSSMAALRAAKFSVVVGSSSAVISFSRSPTLRSRPLESKISMVILLLMSLAPFQTFIRDRPRQRFSLGAFPKLSAHLVVINPFWTLTRPYERKRKLAIKQRIAAHVGKIDTRNSAPRHFFGPG